MAGAQNALAGGGSFVTLGALVFAGLDPQSANITSTVALFPGMVATSYASSRTALGLDRLSLTSLVLISVAGGLAGGVLLLATPSATFAAMVPWLVLFATAVFFWGSFLRDSGTGGAGMSGSAAAVAQFGIAVYGGYFGGGIGFLMLALLTLAGMPVLRAAATKNVLAAAMNASAFAIFLPSSAVHWRHAVALGAGSIIGGYAGMSLLPRVNERVLKTAIIALGLALTAGLFLRN